MKSKIFAILFLLTSLVACSDDPISIDVVLDQLAEDAKLSLLESDSGEFDRTNTIQVIAYYEDPALRYGNEEPNIDRVYFIKVSGKEIKSTDLIDTGSIGFPDQTEEIVEGFSLSREFGWNGYGTICDLVGDGYDEFIFYEQSGMDRVPYIGKVIEGKMVPILIDSSMYGKRLTDIELLSPGELLLTWPIVDYEKGTSSIQEKKYAWNSEQSLFIEIQ